MHAAQLGARWSRLAIDVAPVAIVVVDCDGTIVAANAALSAMLGYTRDEILGLEVETLVAADRRAAHRGRRRAYARTSDMRPMGLGLDLVAQRKDGTQVPVDVALSHFAMDGRELVLAVIADISERQRLVAALEASERRHRAVLDHAPDGFYIVDIDGHILEANYAYQRLSGYSGDELQRMHVSEINAVNSPQQIREHIAAITAAGAERFESLHRRKDGSVWPVELTVSAIPSAGELFFFVRDLSERKRVEAEREELMRQVSEYAFTDSLTGLPNRRLFMDRLAQSLATSRRHARHGAVLYIDMDRFKALNDTHGHATGDRFLIEVAQRLSASARSEDTVARLGGDEFVVILVDLDADAATAAAQARTCAEKLALRLGQPYRIEHETHISSASIGGTLLPLAGDNVDAVLHRADRAMYRVKSSGGAGCAFEDGAATNPPACADPDAGPAQPRSKGFVRARKR